MNNMMTGQGTPNTAPQQQMGGYGRSMNPRMGMGLGGFGSMRGGYGGGDGMSFKARGFGGFGGFNPMMGGFGGFGGFNPMMGGYDGMGGFNPMMAMGLGAFGGMGGGYGFNPMAMMGGYGQFGGMDRYSGGFQPEMPYGGQFGGGLMPAGPHGGYDLNGRRIGGSPPGMMQNLFGGFGGNQFDQQRQAQQQALIERGMGGAPTLLEPYHSPQSAMFRNQFIG